MAAHSWGYSDHNGPHHWKEHYPLAAFGTRQSPINIKTNLEVYDETLRPLVISYDPTSSKIIRNIGHAFNVVYDDSSNKSVLTGGSLAGVYRLAQFHFHWGTTDAEGSEHTVDGNKFSAEMHLVHWNAEKYESISEAITQPDGIAAVSVLFKVGAPNPSLERIITALHSIKTKGKEAPFTNFNPRLLFPPSPLDYWTYLGSLTTPPVNECVIWHVLRQPMTLSSAQLANFRNLCTTEEGERPCYMVKNYRPPQALKGRVVRSSFCLDKQTKK
ncbi:carbonic anhydrase 1-like [Protopterus annectens]|uniref:carbonic anhydrase 1-like n=1 Tax=Protopterus annectens TaxID=7888 RepID=UPI001CFA5830|nr:carbonic anhydrase 1-like [Protopterus annectens]